MQSTPGSSTGQGRRRGAASLVPTWHQCLSFRKQTYVSREPLACDITPSGVDSGMSQVEQHYMWGFRNIYLDRASSGDSIEA